MKAMLIRRYGGPEVFEAGEVPAPRRRPGEVLVRVPRRTGAFKVSV
jgi:NADPH:quinone reductase-like Zn-dependent oxidoreductase